MKHILLIPNKEKDVNYEVTLSAAKILHEGGAHLYTNAEHTKLVGRCGITAISEDDLFQLIECAVVFGGDGSILDAAPIAIKYKIPLLGVNMGRLGYLAELEPSAISLLKGLLTDDYAIRSIHLFQIKIGKKRLRRLAVNEVTVSRGSHFRIADMELSAGGGTVAYRADGLILATPTGSTAYSLSAGGAVIDPALDLFTVTPICSHSFFSRSLIFSGDTLITVKNKSQDDLLVSIDGRTGDKLLSGDILTVQKSRRKLFIIQLTYRPFLQVLQEKMRLR